jgi:hypothetical protein
VECVLKADDRLPLRVAARDLDGILNRFRARVHQYGFLRSLARYQRVQLLANGDIAFVGQHVKTGVQKTIQLAAHGINHRRRAMSGVEAADAARKVDQAIAVDIFDDPTFGLGNKNRGGVIGRLHNGSIAPLHQRLRARSRNRGA